MQIGFKQDSYTVRESDGTVTVCVNSTTRTFNVPVTLETLDIGTAQGTSLHALLGLNCTHADFRIPKVNLIPKNLYLAYKNCLGLILAYMGMHFAGAHFS